MPHIAISMYAGRSQEDKERLAKAVATAVQMALGSAPSSISVSIKDVLPSQWEETIVQREILERQDELYIHPGYVDTDRTGMAEDLSP